MEIIRYPGKEHWKQLLKRPYVDNRVVMESVQSILTGVKEHGDEALLSFIKKFDGVAPDQLEVLPEEWIKAEEKISAELKSAIILAKNNIEKFHHQQVTGKEQVQTMEGIQCWRKSI